MSVVRDSLPEGTLVGPYRILKLIAQGGFSLIYLAHHDETGEEVVVKELMPKRIAQRDASLRMVPADPKYDENIQQSRRLFFHEVKALASLQHPSIVRILDFLLAYNTGYLVMPNEPGRNLGAYVHERGGGLSTTFILQVFVPILDALSLLHLRSVVHLDVKPGNIHLRHGNRPMLLDLGAVHPLARGRIRGGQVITAGYSPPEQYLKSGQVGPWTDVYAVGASIRACMEGRTPPPAPEREKADALIPATVALKNRYPLALLELVDWAMALKIEDRPQDAGELLAAFLEKVDHRPQAGSDTP
jgi:serine/threonine protein kinase